MTTFPAQLEMKNQKRNNSYKRKLMFNSRYSKVVEE